MPAHRALSSLTLALMLGATASAQAQASAADCVALTDDALRLACYDRWAGRTPAAGAPAASATPAPVNTVASTPAPLAPPAATTAPAAVSTAPPSAHLEARWDLDGRRSPLFTPRPYRPVYLLPATWTDRLNRRPDSPAAAHKVTEDMELRPVEAKYQLSLKAKLAHEVLGMPVSLWGGYTQSSRWQLYNGAASRPFRETDYVPELILVRPFDASLLGWQLRMGSLSLTHESNGRSLPLSRSWNRVIAGVALERGDWVAEFRPWVRLDERTSDDDNPDIEDYVGRAELLLSRYWGEHALSVQLRHSLRGGSRSHGSLQLDWVFPLTGVLHGYFQAFAGDGESLIDYNRRQTKLGLGVTIAGWR